jgi:hypothetical protein
MKGTMLQSRPIFTAQESVLRIPYMFTRTWPNVSPVHSF